MAPGPGAHWSLPGHLFLRQQAPRRSPKVFEEPRAMNRRKAGARYNRATASLCSVLLFPTSEDHLCQSHSPRPFIFLRKSQPATNPSLQVRRGAGRLHGGQPVRTCLVGAVSCSNGSLWVSCCCCNKSPPTQWLKTTYTYYLTLLEVKIHKIKVFVKPAGLCSFLRLQNLFLCPLQLPEAAWTPPLVAPSSTFQASHPAPLNLSLCPLLALSPLLFCLGPSCPPS